MSCEPNRFIRLIFDRQVTVVQMIKIRKIGENELMGHPVLGTIGITLNRTLICASHVRDIVGSFQHVGHVHGCNFSKL